MNCAYEKNPLKQANLKYCITIFINIENTMHNIEIHRCGKLLKNKY